MCRNVGSKERLDLIKDSYFLFFNVDQDNLGPFGSFHPSLGFISCERPVEDTLDWLVSFYIIPWF